MNSRNRAAIKTDALAVIVLVIAAMLAECSTYSWKHHASQAA
jgi:hypothetical protein